MSDFIPLDYRPVPEQEQLKKAQAFYELCSRRRTVREFSSRPVPRPLIETLLATAGTAPSGANRQPWRFVVVTDSALKHKIRLAAEEEERESYGQRMSDQWLEDLKVLGTDWHKEFLEVAPALIVVFASKYEHENQGIHKNYYVMESVGIAVGFLLVALHQAGLVALTHTPSPMTFLQEILERPENEKAFLLLPIGYPKEGVLVPNIGRKKIDEFVQWR